MENELIIIAGATACGKSDAAIELAKKINGEIISADSMQIYKYMDIGTAKVSIEEMQGIKHYLIDELLPNEEYSVAVFQKLAKAYIDEIIQKGKTPIIAGGTGFYINSILYQNDFTETVKDDSYRTELYNLAETKGNEFLHNMLRNIDEESANNIHFNNTKRVIRALEYFYQTGEKISVHNEREKARKPFYNGKIFILHTDRKIMYDRINNRVDKMINNGLVKEVETLLEMGYDKNLVSMQGIGYKEIVGYINKEISLDDAITQLKQNTRHFAKRQLTWFSRQIEGNWIDISQYKNAINIADYINSKR